MLNLSPSAFDRMRRSGMFPVAPLPWPGHPRWCRRDIVAWLGGDDTTTDDQCALLSLAEVARLLNMSKSTAYRNAGRMSLEPTRVSEVGERRYPLLSVHRMLT